MRMFVTLIAVFSMFSVTGHAVAAAPIYVAEDLKGLAASAGKYAAWADICSDPAGAEVRSDFLARAALLAPNEQAGIIKKFEKRYTRKKKQAEPLLEKCILQGKTNCCTIGPSGQFLGAKERYESHVAKLDGVTAPAESAGSATESAAAAPALSEEHSSVAASPAESSGSSGDSVAAAPTSPAVSDTGALAISAAVCDVQVLAGEDVYVLATPIVAPATSVPQEFAQFSGKWIGEWDAQLVPGKVQSGPLCAVLVIRTVDADGRVRGVYSMGRRIGIAAQITDGKFTFGRSVIYTIRLSTEIDGQIAGLRESLGRTSEITMEKVASPAAAPTSPAVSDTSAASPAAAPASAADCDLQLPTEAGIVAPASNVPQEFAQFSGMWTGIWSDGNCAILVIKAIDVEGKVTGFYIGGRSEGLFDSQIIDGTIRAIYGNFMLSAEMDGQIKGGFRGRRITMEKIENP